MSMPWDFLDYWKSDDWKIVDQKLKELETFSGNLRPTRDRTFGVLDRVPLADVRVVWAGHAPYQKRNVSTGTAFESEGSGTLPPALRSVLGEYRRDLGYPLPRDGSLWRWTSQGVLLWNVYPAVREGRPTACQWEQWLPLSREIFDRCAERGIVFLFSGAVARSFAAKYHKYDNCKVIETSLPTPVGSLRRQVPFVGSRVFSTINGMLREIALPPIEWELP